MKKIIKLCLTVIFALTLIQVNISEVSARTTPKIIGLVPDRGLAACLNEKYLKRYQYQPILRPALLYLNLQYKSISCPRYDIENISGIEYLKDLRVLDLNSNRIDDVSKLKNLSNINELNLSHNSLGNVQLNYILGVKDLDVSYNKLTAFDGYYSLSNLNKLDLSNNKLTNISGVEGIINLNTLDVSHNNLNDTQQKYINKIGGLKSLTISYNNFTKLNGLGNLRFLDELDASNNKLTDIESIRNMQFLSRLDLTNNQITDIGSLTGLEFSFLSLKSNRITDLRHLNKLIPRLDRSEIDLSDQYYETSTTIESEITTIFVVFYDFDGSIIDKVEKKVHGGYGNTVVFEGSVSGGKYKHYDVKYKITATIKSPE